MSAYYRAAHRIQAGIAFLMGHGDGFDAVQPKHMRVGVDLSKADQAGLVMLLIKKGVFTSEEYVAAVTKSAEEEADRYEKEVQKKLGGDVKVTLG